MKQIILLTFGVIFFTSLSGLAQVPNPVADNEMRDGSSIRRRSIELERVKREANTPSFQETSEEQKIRFTKIKEDFEGLQKLQAAIIKAYTTEKVINYAKITELATEITKKAIRLNESLFNLKALIGSPKVKTLKQKDVKDLIIELDNAIGDFVDSPVFKNSTTVESKLIEKSQIDLEKIIAIS